MANKGSIAAYDKEAESLYTKKPSISRSILMVNSISIHINQYRHYLTSTD